MRLTRLQTQLAPAIVPKQALNRLWELSDLVALLEASERGVETAT
jgi:hypothetical protein